MIKLVYKIIAVTGLLLTLIPAYLHYTGIWSGQYMKTMVFIATVIWFIGATPWLGKKKVNH